MIKTGLINKLELKRMVDFGAYLESESGQEVLLPNKYLAAKAKIGDMLEVFIYTDSEDRLIATNLKPLAMLGECAFLKVKEVTFFGTFFDWGLEKDLLVPFNQQSQDMGRDEKHVVRLCLDENSGRIYGTTRISQSSEKLKNEELKPGQQVEILIHRDTKFGKLAVINHRWEGMIYKDNIFEKLKIGDKRTAYISRIRDDGKINLSLKEEGFASISSSKEDILALLKKSKGFLPYTDKSKPQEIYSVFSMSKKEFKKAIGGLLKEKKISLSDKGFSLVE